jgi:cysteine desulfurase family protein (TIGR01976 family)
LKLNVEAVRACYPALADGYAYLDGAAGTQVPAAVIDAISQAQSRGLGNSGGAFPASHRADAITAASRAAVAALTGGDPGGVIFGPSMTALTYRLAGALAKDWRPGDEVVVTRLDHDANVRPWVQAAERAGAVVRWAAVDSDTGELPTAQFADLLSDKTRLVAVSAASNVIGTRPDVPAITAMVRAAGALSYVDGVHATPHVPVDVRALGADFYATSAYKWSGPHIGTVVADPALLAGLRPDKLIPSPDEVPERFELGTLPFASLAGVTAAVDHLAGLADLSGDGTAPSSDGAALSGDGTTDAGPGDGASLRERVLTSMASVQEYEQELFGVLLAGLDSMQHVRTFGRAASRTATAYFTVAGQTPQQVAEHMASRKINVWHGDNYAWEVTGVLGIRDAGSAVRAGLVHYNDGTDVDRLLTAVAELG